jgi:O-antigen ligase
LAFRSRAADVLPLVAAAAIPLIFLHRMYQAHASVGPVDVYGSDVAILVTLLAAAAAGICFGWERLLRPRALWLVAAALLVLLAVSCLWRPIEAPKTHLITAAKVIEYALLAPAAVLLFRRTVDLERFLAVFVAWNVAASVWGLLQFLGIVSEFEGKRPGQREVSFLGHQDLGAFSGATLAIGFAAIVLHERRRLGQVAVAAGAFGVILDASIFAYFGVVLAAIAAAWVGRRTGTLTVRRAVALASILAVVGAGVYVLRGSDVTDYLSFLGVRQPAASTGTDVQSGSQRTMLAYIGLRIWEDHPILGVGFDRSANRYQPYLADAKRKFPDQPAQAYPSPQHRWGVQNFWLQLLADVGIVGLALGVATFATGLWLALRTPPKALFFGLAAAGWILVAGGTWNAVGIVAGIPLEAVTWLGLGLAVAVQELR